LLSAYSWTGSTNRTTQTNRERSVVNRAIAEIQRCGAPDLWPSTAWSLPALDAMFGPSQPGRSIQNGSEHVWCAGTVRAEFYRDGEPVSLSIQLADFPAGHSFAGSLFGVHLKSRALPCERIGEVVPPPWGTRLGKPGDGCIVTADKAQTPLRLNFQTDENGLVTFVEVHNSNYSRL
jgi:hypothetical protein